MNHEIMNDLNKKVVDLKKIKMKFIPINVDNDNKKTS